MPDLKQIFIFIASPGDVAQARDIVRHAIERINRTFGISSKLMGLSPETRRLTIGNSKASMAAVPVRVLYLNRSRRGPKATKLVEADL